MEAQTINPPDVSIDDAKKLLDDLPPMLCQYGRDKAESVGGVGPNCDEIATWLLVLSCGHDAPLCDDHKIKIDRSINRGFPVTCSKAGGEAGEAHPAGIRVTFEWRRIA